MRHFLTLLLLALCAAALQGQSLPLGTDHAVTTLECKTDFVSFSDGTRFFDGIVITQGRRAYYLDKPFAVKVVGQRLTFTDSEPAVDKVTVSLSQTAYGTLGALMAAVEACNSGAWAGSDSSIYELLPLQDVIITANGNDLAIDSITSLLFYANTDTTASTISANKAGAVLLASLTSAGASGVGFEGETGDGGLIVDIDGASPDSGQIMVADTNGLFQFQDFPFGMGAISTTTSAGGDVVVTHGMGATPTAVVVTPSGTTAWIVSVHTIGATTFTVRFYTDAGAPVNAGAVTASWLAKKL